MATVPITRVQLGDVTAFDSEYADVISLEPVSAIQYPVVTLANHRRYFYDIRHLIHTIQFSHKNEFPHNRQRIDWSTDLDVAEWNNVPLPAELPANYVAKTRTYLEAARAYAPIWTDQESLRDDVKEQDRYEQKLRYINYRNEYAARTQRDVYNADHLSFAALWAERYLSRYWIAHPYTAEDQRLGIREPNPNFIRRCCAYDYSQNDAYKEESFKCYRRQEAQLTNNTFLSDSEEESESENSGWRQEMSARYWDAHPLDPLRDDAEVIATIRDNMYHMLPYIERLRGRLYP
jgi:hypothetical protein